MPRQQYARGHRHEEPLVRIDRDGISAMETLEFAQRRLKEQSSTAVASIDVEP